MSKFEIWLAENSNGRLPFVSDNNGYEAALRFYKEAFALEPTNTRT